MRDRATVFPPALASRARQYVAQGRGPTAPRPSSTVALVRDGLEVYVHVRQSTMAFAGGMLAFPGGKVDPGDREHPIEDETWWASRLGTDELSARAHVRAAAREMLEETGVLLTDADLHPWAHWITPRFEPRRYDTWFFLAAAPDDQVARDVSGEASAVTWAAPQDLLTGRALPGVVMLPPTRSILTDLVGYASVAGCLAASRGHSIPAVLPGWIDDGDDVHALLPGDAEYPGDDHGRTS